MPGEFWQSCASALLFLLFLLMASEVTFPSEGALRPPLPLDRFSFSSSSSSASPLSVSLHSPSLSPSASTTVAVSAVCVVSVWVALLMSRSSRANPGTLLRLCGRRAGMHSTGRRCSCSSSSSTTCPRPALVAPARALAPLPTIVPVPSPLLLLPLPSLPPLLVRLSPATGETARLGNVRCIRRSTSSALRPAASAPRSLRRARSSITLRLLSAA
mmetsp:Transcript_31617/g.71890  ORF Transcript_31617/g.71890 Transcript_31617/m.71890 type:complete len:215 (-) Transcript_31617:100-744(-)